VKLTTFESGVAVPFADWVVAENERVGTLDWDIAYPNMLYGYADHVSAVAADVVTLFVDASGPFHVELYRMGY
jgi:hypothetical protein